MRKFAALILAVFLMLSMSACIVLEDTSEIASTETEDVTPEYNADVNTEEESTEESAEESVEEEVEEVTADAESIAEQVVYDKDGIVITATGIESDLWSSKIKLQLENNSDTNATVQVLDFTINDLVMDPLFSCDVAVGKKANDDIEIYASDLDVNGIETIMNIEFRFNVFNTDTWDTIDDSTLVKLETSKVGTVEQLYDDSGDTVFEDQGIRVIAKKLEVDGSWLGSELYLYIENNSDRSVMITVENTSVNGYMIEPIFYSEVPAGKKAYDSIIFIESDLEANGITSIESFEGSFTISDAQSWDTIAATGAVTINFTE